MIVEANQPTGSPPAACWLGLPNVMSNALRRFQQFVPKGKPVESFRQDVTDHSPLGDEVLVTKSLRQFCTVDDLTVYTAQRRVTPPWPDRIAEQHTTCDQANVAADKSNGYSQQQIAEH